MTATLQFVATCTGRGVFALRPAQAALPKNGPILLALRWQRMNFISAPVGPVKTQAIRPERSVPADVSDPEAPRSLYIGFLLTLIFVFLVPGVGLLGALAMIVDGAVRPHHLLMLAIGWLLTGLGITVGYHRMLTHRSFETSPAMRAILLILGSMAIEGPAVAWVANHVKHHGFSDRPGDPHSPKEGFLHAHWGWLFRFSTIELEKYGADAAKDPIARWVSGTFVLWVVLSYTIPFLIAGWEGLIWGGLFRQFCVQNVTFAVNSVCHTWGTRPFKTTDNSRNNVFVGVLGLGEGWHNNHHAFPFSAYHGLRWWEFDISGLFIGLLEKLGLAWNVKRPDPRLMALRLFDPTPILAGDKASV